MTFKELKEKAKGLKTSIDEDTAVLKYKLFLPVFKNLYEEKERCYLIKAENIKISPEYFEATAVIIENLYTLYNLPDFNKNWRFGFNWGFASITSDNSFYFPYGSYRVWTEKETIQHVEKLITENRKDKICDFFYIKTKTLKINEQEVFNPLRYIWFLKFSIFVKRTILWKQVLTS